jgi:hypothetical protein
MSFFLIPRKMRPGLRLYAIRLRQQQGGEIAKIPRPGHPKKVSRRARPVPWQQKPPY